MRVRAAVLALAVLAGGAVALAPVAAAAGTSYTYTAGGADTSDWNDASNWTPSGVPGTGDSVTVAPPSQSHCSAVLADAPTVTLADLTVSEDGPCDGTTSVSGGTLTVSGTFTWHGGRIETPLVLPSGSTGTISPGTRTTSAVSELDSTLDVGGTLNLTGDEKTPAVDKSLMFGDAGTAANGQLADGITVESGATLRAAGTDDLTAPSCCTNPARVVNRGTIDATDGSLLRFDGAVLDQDGTLHTDGSSSEVDNFAGTPAEPNTAGDASYTGPGTYRLSIGRAALAADGTLNVASGFRFVLGGQGSSAVAPDSDETISGTFVMIGDGEFDWLGGRVDGNVLIRMGTVRIGTTGTTGTHGHEGDPGETTYVQDTSVGGPSTVQLFSPVTFAPGADAATPDSMRLDGGSTLDLELSTSVPAYVRWSGDGHLDNVHTFVVDAGGGSDYVEGRCQVTNTGLVWVRSGTLKIDRDYRQIQGGTRLASGGRVRVVRSSSVVRLAGGRLVGSGTVRGAVDSAAVLDPGGGGIGTLTVDGRYHQGRNARAQFALARTSGDRFVVHGSLTFHGKLYVDTQYHPKASATRTIVTGTKRPTLGLSCISGSFVDAEKHARHWVAEVKGTSIVLRSARGAGPHC